MHVQVQEEDRKAVRPVPITKVGQSPSIYVLAFQVQEASLTASLAKREEGGRLAS